MNVVDTVAPVITLVGSSPIDVEAGTVYLDAGATAFDAGDGDLTAAIVTVNPVDTSTLGSYTVTYNVTDSQGHPATEVTRTVNVIDTTPPVITLIGANPQIIEVGSPYVELGATASDAHDGNLSAAIVINAAGVDTTTLGTYSVVYSVADSSGNITTANRTVQVVNAAPTLDFIANQTVDELTLLAFTATATDPDPTDVLTFTLAGAPAGAAISPTGGFTWTPTETQGPGVFTFNVVVGDAGTPTRTDLQTITVTVAEVNAPPTVTDPGTVTGDERTLITFTAAGSDVDRPANTLTYGITGAPAGAAIDPTTGVFTWTPTEAQGPGTYNLMLNVDDGAGANAGVGFVVTVGEVNAAPHVLSPGDQTNAENESVAVFVPADDAGDIPANAVTWSATGLPTGLSISPTSGQITGTIGFDAAAGSPHTVSVTVTDNGVPARSASANFLWIVTNTNRAPIATDDTALTSEDVPLGINVVGNDTDPDGSALVITSATNGLHGTVTFAGGGATYTPDPNWNGTDGFDYTVTDPSGATSSASVVVTVQPMPDAPVLSAAGPWTVVELTTGSFPVTATDPDAGETLVFSLNGAPFGVAIDAAAGTITWRPTEGQGPSIRSFDVVVTDTTGRTDQMTVQITVTEAPRPPVLAPIADVTVSELTAASFTASATDPDIPASAVTYRLAGSPSGAVIDAASGAFFWTPTEAQGPGSFTFDVVATDSGGLEDRESVTITVTETNVAPVLEPISQQTVDEGTTLTFTAVATDRDRPANTLTFALIDPPFGASIDANTGVFTWTPAEAQGPRTHRFSITVSDNALVGPSATNVSATRTVTIDVNETNQPPVVETPGNQETPVGASDSLRMQGSDPDVPANTLTWAARGLPPGMTIGSTYGVIAGTPIPGSAATHTVTVTLSDEFGASDTTSFDWIVSNPPPGAPVVVDDYYTVGFGGILTPPEGVLENDRDPDGGSLSAFAYTEPTKGRLTLNSDGSFTYRHNAGSSGTDQFTYEVEDPNGDRDWGDVYITIINKPPEPEPESVFVDEDGHVDFDPVVDSDHDPENYPLTVVAWTSPRNGGITTPTSEKNTLRYKPKADFNGEDVFRYTVEDPGGLRASTEVRITVRPVNDAPVGGDDAFIVEDYQPMELSVLANDTDVDGDPLRIARVSVATLGTVTILDHRSLSYDPTSGKTGVDTITYTVIDGNGGSTDVTTTILIPEAVLTAGEDLFDDVGPDGVEISAGETEGATIGGFSIQSVTLMADAFWQTVLALRVPMFFLLLALGSVIVGGGLTNAPIFVAARRKRYYAGVLLHREGFLIAYQEPNTDSEIVYRFQPTARSIHATGRPQEVNNAAWIPVTTANGKGWIDANHLVQEVDIGTFMEDQRPPQLVAEFVERLRNGQSIKKLLSRDGLLLALAHDVSFVPASMALRLAARDRTDESWSGALAAFMTAYDATEEISPRNAHSSVALLPSECQNFLYLALEPDALGRPWLVYIEYKDKTPYIVGLGIDL